MVLQFGAQVLGKPEAYITAQYNHNDTITFGGSHQPAFDLRIVCSFYMLGLPSVFITSIYQISLGNLSHDQNEIYSSKFSKWLKDELNLEDNRGYISFLDPGNSNIGWVAKQAVSTS